MKIGLNIHKYAKKAQQHIANIPLKDGSSVKLLFPGKLGDTSYTAIHMSKGKILGMKGYKGSSIEEMAAFNESLQKFAAKGVDVCDEYFKALHSPYGGI